MPISAYKQTTSHLSQSHTNAWAMLADKDADNQLLQIIGNTKCRPGTHLSALLFSCWSCMDLCECMWVWMWVWVLKHAPGPKWVVLTVLKHAPDLETGCFNPGDWATEKRQKKQRKQNCAVNSTTTVCLACATRFACLMLWWAQSHSLMWMSEEHVWQV